MATSWIQWIYYGITIRAGDRRPQPNEEKFHRHNRRIRIAVVVLYLLYQIYETDWEIRRAGDYYQDLGVSHSIDDRGIKSRFRRLAALHHPDKVSSSNPDAETYFVHLKHAQDTLMDPVKRFAYDRFGPGIFEMPKFASIKEYVQLDRINVTWHYAGSAFVIYLLGMTGLLPVGTFWRWFTLLVLCVFELHTITRPHSQTIVARLVNPVITTFTNHPPYLPFQLITLLRKMAVTLHAAISHIGPLLESRESQIRRMNPEAALTQHLNRLEQVAATTDAQARDLLLLEMIPYKGDHQAMSQMVTTAKDWLVSNSINHVPEVRDARGNLMKRRRLDVPAGARGNR